MKKLISRRNFLKVCALAALPLLCLPVAAANPPAATILLPQLWTRPVPLNFRCPKRSPLPV